MDYKIIACDLDGTLLNTKMEISPENISAIKELSKRGVHFVPCTGRTFEEIPEIVRNLDGVRFFIHSGGAVVYDKETGDKIDMCMSKEQVAFVIDTLKRYECFYTVRHNGKSYLDKTLQNKDFYYSHRLSDNCVKFLYTTNNAIDNFEEFCRSLDRVEMICTYFKFDSEKEECREIFKKAGVYSVVSSEYYNLEASDISAGKGKALLKLAEKLGFDKSQTIAMGDSKNDENAILLAGLSLVMSNGTDELKALADEIICSNDEHAVKYVLENYFN